MWQTDFIAMSIIQLIDEFELSQLLNGKKYFSLDEFAEYGDDCSKVWQGKN